MIFTQQASSETRKVVLNVTQEAHVLLHRACRHHCRALGQCLATKNCEDHKEHTENLQGYYCIST